LGVPPPIFGKLEEQRATGRAVGVFSGANAVLCVLLVEASERHGTSFQAAGDGPTSLPRSPYWCVVECCGAVQSCGIKFWPFWTSSLGGVPSNPRGRGGLAPVSRRAVMPAHRGSLYPSPARYEGELPPPEAFTTHGHAARHILGPFPTRAVAEASSPGTSSRNSRPRRPLWCCTPARAMAMTDEQRRWLYVLAAAIVGGAGAFLLLWWLEW
jgi:hypothetical protein